MNFMCGRVGVIVAVSNPKHAYTVVSFNGDDDCGLYVSRLVNDFGTPLAARGTRAELEAFVIERGGTLR